MASSTPLHHTVAVWSTAPKCSSTRPTLNPSGSVTVRMYHRYSSGCRTCPTPDSSLSGEKGTRIVPSACAGLFALVVIA